MSYRNGSETQTNEAQSIPPTDPPVTLKAFLRGQRQINGRLCQVDQELVKAIAELRNAVDRVLKIDLTAVNAAIDEAQSYSDAIPGVNPPGCEYPGSTSGGTGTSGGPIN